MREASLHKRKNMKNIKDTFRAGIAVAAGLVAMYSCTDSWDDHYSAVNPALKFDGTLMQALEKNAPDFAKVVKAYGFERELASDNAYTVWAPIDNSFKLSDYVGENGEMLEDSSEVVNDFIKNHVARYYFSQNEKEQNFSLLNEKRGTMDGSKFGTVEIDSANISCANGVLHLIDTPSPFAYNLFQFIAKQYKEDPEQGKDTLSLYKYLEKYNQDSLIENKSVSHGLDAEGNKIWVSKYMMRNNTALKNVDAKIYEEDSSFIAIVPTAKAWAERYKIAESLLKFNPSEDDRQPGTCDSLTRRYASAFAMTDLYYNKNANEHWQDSLKSTDYYTLWHGVKDWTEHVYYSTEPKVMPEGKSLNNILAKCGEPVSCSNGDAYLVDEYPMTEYEQFFKRIKVFAHDGTVNKLSGADGTMTYTKRVGDTFRRQGGQYSETMEEVSDEGELVSVTKRQDYGFVDFAPTSGNIAVGFNIPNTLSGKYDLYLLTCPIWLKNDYINIPMEEWDLRPYRFKVNVIERVGEAGKKDVGTFPAKGVTLDNPNTTEDEKSTNIFLTEGLRYDDSGFIMVNDTTFLGSYEFQNAYYGRSDYGVIIQVESNVLSSQRKEFSPEMLISSILLVPHNDDEPAQGVAPAPAQESKRRKAIKLTNSNIR